MGTASSLPRHPQLHRLLPEAQTWAQLPSSEGYHLRDSRKLCLRSPPPLIFSSPPEIPSSPRARPHSQSRSPFLLSHPMSVCTVKVSDISPRATLQDIKEFFSFSGDIVYIEIESGNEVSMIAYITFKDPQGAETAQLLTGATIIDRHVDISFAEHYHLPPAASAPAPPKDDNKLSGAASAVKKAEDVVSAMLAKGFILGKDVINKAKAFDEKHQLMSTASAKVSSLDKKIGLTEKVSVGASAVSEKVKEADEKYHVSEKTKSAFETAKEKVSSAGSILFRNRFVSAGVSFVYGALSRVTRRGAEIPAASEENVPDQQEQSRAVEEDFAKMHLSHSAHSEKSVSVPQEPTKKADDELAEVHLTETPRSQIAPPAEIAAAQG